MSSFFKKIVRPILKKVGLYDSFYRQYFSLSSTWYSFTNVLKKKFYRTAVILTYHRIDTILSDPHLLCVTPQSFEKHLQFLKENYEVVPLPELLDRLQNRQLTGREAVITFDDGYRDNLINGLPLLQKFNLPATIFITTSCLGQLADFAWDRDYSPQDRAVFLNTDEIVALSKDPLITIGAHTHTHPRLSALTSFDQLANIKESKNILENILKQKIDLFAYPFGGIFDFNKATVQNVLEIGFGVACTTIPRLVTYKSKKLELPRFNVRDYPVEELSQKLFYSK